jgi:polysaccharide export outer membrane protein
MRIKYNALLVLVVIFFIFSCTPYKQVPYFQDLSKDSSVINQKINNFSLLTIQPGDLLDIDVNSLNHDADQLFKYSKGPDLTAEVSAGGYLVSPEGNVNLPLIGHVSVTGLSTQQISDTLQSKLAKYLSSPVVNVRILNFKVSVIGDVKNPGRFNIQNEKLSLLDAISLAGDLNTTGERSNVLLIREQNGTREYVRLNLDSKSVFTSPYYYLKNNDVIYVQPNRARTTSDDASISKIGAVVSVLSLLIYLLTRL